MSTRILLVDDSPDILFLYKAVLESIAEWEVETALNGRQAFALARSWHPHLVITDLMMPEMNGLDLITQIRSDIAPPVPRMIAISGFPDLGGEALNRGAEAFHLKPLLPADLIAIVHQLDGHSAAPSGVPDHTVAERMSARQRAESSVQQALARQPDMAVRMALAAQVTSNYFGKLSVAVIVVHDGELRVAASAGPIALQAGAPIREVIALAAHVIESGSRFVVTDLATLPALRLPGGAGLRFLAIMPISGPEETIVGGLALLDDHPISFDATDLTLVEHIARWGTIMFSSAARRVMLTDSGLFQPRSWTTWLNEEMTHVRNGGALGVALIEPAAGEQVDFEQACRLWSLVPARTALTELEDHVIAAYTIGAGRADVERRLEELLLTAGEVVTWRAGSLVTFLDIDLPNEAESALEIASAALQSAREQPAGTVVRTLR